ncbi:MAG: transporter, partial [Sandaracinaceae bacterium]
MTQLPSSRALSLAAVLAAALVPSAAGAQGIELDLYRGAETSEDGFAISSPTDRGHLRPGFQLHLDYGLRPLVDRTVAPRIDLVEHMATGRIVGSFGLFDRFVVFASVPVVFVMEGDATGDQIQADGAGLGDVTVGSRFRLVGGPDELFRFALQLTAGIPTAEAVDSDQLFRGEAGVTFQPELLAELRPGPFRLTLNGGARVRQEVEIPDGASPDVALGQELTWGIGVGLFVLPDLLEVRVEGYGAYGLRNPGQALGNPAEALAGVRVTPLPGWTFGLAAGPGIGRGYGVPAFRGVVTVGWAEPAGDPWYPRWPEAEEEVAANGGAAGPGAGAGGPDGQSVEGAAA